MSFQHLCYIFLEFRHLVKQTAAVFRYLFIICYLPKNLRQHPAVHEHINLIKQIQKIKTNAKKEIVGKL